MNVNLLNTLLKLFAIIVRDDGLTEENTLLVKNFLTQQFNDYTARQYLETFRGYALQENAGDEHQNIISLCNSVNNELTYEQKIFILIRVIELAFADNKVSMHEVKKIVLAAKHLNIEYKEYLNLFNFITTQSPLQLQLQNLMCFGLEGEQAGQPIQELPRNAEYFAVLHIKSANLFLLRYIGRSEVNLNGQPIKSQVVYILQQGSVLRFQKLDPIYYSDIVDHFLYSTRGTALVFEVQNVSFRFKEGKIGLHPINLREESGKMVAVMGGSGAGKSTLLNVLNGNNRPFDGKVTINGVSIHEKNKEIEGVIGFVAQEDILIEELTVYENLYFNAQLCFNYLKEPELDALVNDMLTELGLQETRDLRVGDAENNTNISGGQRKRLNIALELIREPSILFVDEPTSGLSSRDSENVMDLLKELAHKGKLVIVVIHQPSSYIFKLFDKLLILDKGGFPVYYGNPTESIRYFRRELNYVNSELVDCPECGTINPEQIFTMMETKVIDEFGNPTRLRKVEPVEWYRRFQQWHKVSGKQEEYEELDTNLHIPSGMKQFRIFAKRDLLSKLANKAYMVISFAIAPLLALGIAFLLRSVPLSDLEAVDYTLYTNDNLTIYLFVSILISLFIGLTISSEEILRDRKLRKREAFLNLSKSSYLLSKIGVLFGFTAVQMLLYAFLGNWVLDIHGMALEYWLMLFTVGCFSVMLGLNVSATFDSAVTIYILIPILLIPQIVLSGTTVSFYKLNPLITNVKVAPLISDFAASRWAYEGMAVRQFKDNAHNKHFFHDDQTMFNAQFKTGVFLPELATRIDFCIDHHQNAADKAKVAAKLAMVQRYLRQELSTFKHDHHVTLRRLTPDRFNDEVGAEAKNIIKLLEKKHHKYYEQARKNKEKTVNRLKQLGVDLDKLQAEHDNEYLGHFVRNSLTRTAVIESQGELVRVMDPIYQFPDTEKGFLNYREHFYAPSKYFMGHQFDTYWFNMLFIWFMTTVLYGTLYHESFRKLLTSLTVIRNRIVRRYFKKR